MTVAELILKLQEMPQDADVEVYSKGEWIDYFDVLFYGESNGFVGIG